MKLGYVYELPRTFFLGKGLPNIAEYRDLTSAIIRIFGDLLQSLVNSHVLPYKLFNNLHYQEKSFLFQSWKGGDVLLTLGNVM